MNQINIFNIWARQRKRTGTFHIDKVDIMGRGMGHRPEGHGVGDLSMEPNVLVGGKEPCKLGTDDTNDVAQHRDKDETAIECEYQTGATRNPNREFEAVQTGKPGVRCLDGSDSQLRTSGAV